MGIEPGQTLSHYRLIEKIGEGGMGVVYRATDERLERDVAIKVLPADAFLDEGVRKRFRKEALTLSKLNHPNIATIHDFDSQDMGQGPVDFLVMEYVEGLTLGEWLRRGKPSTRDLARLALQIVNALQEAHEHGIVHRDLKPGNILVTTRGQVKVLDFGLARLLAPAVDVSKAETRSRTEGVVGTLPYMAPEQLRGEAVDARADLFALGAVMYEMATGRLAFGQGTAPQVTEAVLHLAPVTPRALNAAVSPGLEHIILKCLEKDSENRYQTAKEVAVDLRRQADPTSAGFGSPDPPRFRRNRIVLIALAIGIPAAAGLLWTGSLLLRDQFFVHASVKRITSLAVLPLENLSGDPEQQYFVDGMHDALIADLSKIGALRVISRTSVMRFKGTSKSVPDIGRELGVDAVIEGSVMRAGNQVRITAQLIQAPTDTHLWAESYDGDLRNVLALQQHTADAITRQIKIVVTPKERALLASDDRVNPAAYEAYLKGRFYLSKDNEEGGKKAIEEFNLSTTIDPTYAAAYSALAHAYIWAGVPASGPSADSARTAAKRALELDDNLAEAHVALAEVMLHLDWAWTAAEGELKRAIELDASSVEAHRHYSHLLMDSGRFDESLREATLAADLDPLNLPVTNHLAYHYFLARQYDKMLDVAQHTLDLDPSFKWGWMARGMAYAFNGMYDEAVRDTEKAAALEGRTGEVLSQLGVVYGMAGRHAEALAILKDLKLIGSDYGIATVYAALGEREQAFSWIEKAFADRETALVQIKVDPLLDPLRTDPRFPGLVKRVNLLP